MSTTLLSTSGDNEPENLPPLTASFAPRTEPMSTGPNSITTLKTIQSSDNIDYLKRSSSSSGITSHSTVKHLSERRRARYERMYNLISATPQGHHPMPESTASADLQGHFELQPTSNVQSEVPILHSPTSKKDELVDTSTSGESDERSHAPAHKEVARRALKDRLTRREGVWKTLIAVPALDTWEVTDHTDSDWVGDGWAPSAQQRLESLAVKVEYKEMTWQEQEHAKKLNASRKPSLLRAVWSYLEADEEEKVMEVVEW